MYFTAPIPIYAWMLFSKNKYKGPESLILLDGSQVGYSEAVLTPVEKAYGPKYVTQTVLQYPLSGANPEKTHLLNSKQVSSPMTSMG